MPTPLIALPLALAAVFLLAAIAKFRAPSTLAAGASSLGLPGWLSGPAVLRTVPYAETLLALGLAFTCGGLFLATAVAASILLAVYLVVVSRAVAAPQEARCACFGETEDIVDGWTIARNAVLLGCGLVAVALALDHQAPISVLRTNADQSRWWVAAVAVVAALTYLSTRHTAAAGGSPVAASGHVGDIGTDVDEDDYLRVPIPPVAVETRDGKWLRPLDLATTQPTLLLYLSPGCGSCRPVDDIVPTWRNRLPLLNIQALFAQGFPPDETFVNLGPTALRDEGSGFANAVGLHATPSAVLLGADGLLAGGPVEGRAAIEQFVADIEAELAEAGIAAD